MGGTLEQTVRAVLGQWRSLVTGMVYARMGQTAQGLASAIRALMGQPVKNARLGNSAFTVTKVQYPLLSLSIRLSLYVADQCNQGT